jgi:hypothetical protein
MSSARMSGVERADERNNRIQRINGCASGNRHSGCSKHCNERTD